MVTMSHRSGAVIALQGFLRQLERQGVDELYLTRSARHRLEHGLRGPVCEAHGVALETDVPSVAALQGDELLHAECHDIDRVAPVSYHGASPVEQLADLRRQACLAEGPLSAGTFNPTVVFSSGSSTADLMFVADAPGIAEEREGLPVAGDDGEKLRQILKAMGLSRDGVYVTNLCKFRPAMKREDAHLSRKPSPEEMRSWLPFLLAEIEIIRPKVIVALGNVAAEGLLRIDRASITHLRGQFHDCGGVPLMVTHHPSHLLLADSDADAGSAKKRLYWEDMLLVMEALGLAVTEKQKRYFT